MKSEEEIGENQGKLDENSMKSHENRAKSIQVVSLTRVHSRNWLNSSRIGKTR